MTYRVSEHDLWGMGDNRLVSLPPDRDDLFVVSTVAGNLMRHGPVTEYQNEIRHWGALLRRVRGDRPLVVKVFCVTLAEAQAWGFAPKDLFTDLTPEEEHQWDREVYATCIDLLHKGTDPKSRETAMDLLRGMGALR